MRCKNCGTENDDNRYICENCGSPLYDEDDFISGQPDSQLPSQDAEDNIYIPEASRTTALPQNVSSNQDKPADKKSIIVIAILAVVLVAIIASVIVIATTKSKNEDESTSVSTTQSTVSQTEPDSTKKTTTEKTTESTTKETTTKETTTKAKLWSIKVTSGGGGTVSGSGNYKDGDNVTITATPNESYVFEGWYSNGEKISSAATYSFSAVENKSISASFVPAETTTEDIENLEGGLD